MKTLSEITAKYDDIIKSKWRLMCEVSCLPDSYTAADGFIKQYSTMFDMVREELGSKRENLFLFWRRVNAQGPLDVSAIQLCFPMPDGTIQVAAQWEMEISSLEETKNAVKGIKLVVPEDGNKPIDELLHNILQLVDTDVAGRVRMWKALPENERSKESSIVCPRCGERGGIYVGEYSESGHTVHATTCGRCDFIGPYRNNSYDAMDSFLNRYDSIRKQEEKRKRFHETVAIELAEIETHVAKLAALASDKSVAYTNWDVENILKKYEAAGQKLFSMKKQEKKKG